MSTNQNQSFIYETDRLRLRGLYHSDIDGPYAHWFNDQEVSRHNSHGIFPSTREKLTAFIDMVQTTDAHIVWAIIEKERNVHVGNIALQTIDRVRQSAALSFVLGDKNCWGKGYGEEAGRTLLFHAFQKVGLRRVSCGTSEHNIGMNKLAEKLGMKKEGVRREAFFENGKFVDTIEYGILKKEFDPEI